MARTVQPAYGPNIGQIVSQGLGVYQQIKGIQTDQAKSARTDEVRELTKRASQGDKQALEQLYAIDPQAASQINTRQRQVGAEAAFQNISTDPKALQQYAMLDPPGYKRLIDQREQDKLKEIEDKTRFLKESSILASAIIDKPIQQKIPIIKAQIKSLESRGINSDTTKRLLSMYESGDPEAIKQADEGVNSRYVLGIERGIIKPGKEPETAGFRPATEEEKSAAGITDTAPYQISLRGKTKGKFVKMGGSGQTINISTGEYKPGKIPSGQMLIEEGGSPVLKDIPGGPQAKEVIEKEKKEQLRKEETAKTANIVQEDIRALISKIGDETWYNPVTGISGAVASNVPGSARADAEALKNTITANIGFDKLAAIKASSKTGGGLGAISEREMSQLQAVMGSIDFTQSKEQLERNLNRLDKLYSKILAKARDYPNAAEFGFGPGIKAIPVSQQQGQPQMTEEMKKRYQ